MEENKKVEVEYVDAHAKYMPTVKIIVHNLIEIPLENIVAFSVPVVYWCKGYILIMNALPFQSDSVAKAFMEGELHISDLFYIKTEYKPELEIGYAKIKVVDMSNSFIHQQLVDLINNFTMLNKKKGDKND